MDGHRFDDLARALGASGTRRGFLKGLLGAAVGAGLLGGGGDAARAQASQAQCGNASCARNPGKCKPGCVCCAYGNGNSRCGAPGECGGAGTITCPAGLTYCPDLGRCAACCTSAGCPAPADPCQVAICQNGTCGLVPGNDGASCDDGDRCTVGDTCSGGVCIGGAPVVCQPLDQCHVAGTCDPTTGACSNPNAPDGTGCNDDNACSTGDTCQAGACTGGTSLTCTTDNPCRSASCDPVQGCITTPKGRGEACGNGNPCDGDEVCDGAGACVPGTPVSCGPCLACDPGSGSCVAANEGGPCPGEGDRCFDAFVCRAGACVGERTVVCQASDQCHTAGICDPATGLCSNPDAADGTDCEDGNLCTGFDSCLAGVCRPGIFSTLCLVSTCAPQVACNPATGQCEATTPAPNGTDCTSPFDSCSTRACQDGACVVTSTVDCSALDNECGVGTCDRVTGGCTTSPRSNSDRTPCTGDDPCTAYFCAGGTCTAFGPDACPDPPECKTGVGVCDSSTGACTYENAPDFTACDASEGGEHVCFQGACTCRNRCDGACCGVGEGCCARNDGTLICLPEDRICEGQCFLTAATCCGQAFGTPYRCPANETCCAADVGFGGDGCCNFLEQCGAFGCNFFTGG